VAPGVLGPLRKLSKVRNWFEHSDMVVCLIGLLSPELGKCESLRSRYECVVFLLKLFGCIAGGYHEHCQINLRTPSRECRSKFNVFNL
jgi:hypothetical protein